MTLTWEIHHARKVLRIDYAGLKGRDLMQAIKHTDRFFKDSEAWDILELVDVRGTIVDLSAFEEIKRISKISKSMVAKCAIIGISGLKMKFYEAYVNWTNRQNIKCFTGEEEALAWLTCYNESQKPSTPTSSISLLG